MVSSNEKLYIKSQVVKINQGQISNIELSKFINYLKNLIHNHLYLYKTSFIKFVDQFGLDCVDISIDVAAELFKKNQNGEFTTIDNFIKSFNSPIEEISPDDFFLSFMALVRRITDFTIARNYSENDTFGYKILRNIRNHLPNEHLEIHNFLGENYIRVKLENNNHLPYLEFESFKKLFLSESANNNNIPELLLHLENCLMKLEEYRKEIKLIEAVILFKEVYLSINIENLSDENEKIVYDHHSDFIDLGNLKNKCLKIIQAKLFDYLNKNRFTENQIKAIYFAMEDILNDLIFNGGTQQSLINYLNKYIDTKEDEYKLNYKTKIEYLNKIIREEIIKYLTINNSSS